MTVGELGCEVLLYGAKDCGCVHVQELWSSPRVVDTIVGIGSVGFKQGIRSKYLMTTRHGPSATQREQGGKKVSFGYNVPPQNIEQFKAHLALLVRTPTGGINVIDAETAEIMFRSLHGQHNAILDRIPKDSDPKRREVMVRETHEIMKQWLVIDKFIKDTNSDPLLYERDRLDGRELRRGAMVAYYKAVRARVALGH